MRGICSRTSPVDYAQTQTHMHTRNLSRRVFCPRARTHLPTIRTIASLQQYHHHHLLLLLRPYIIQFRVSVNPVRYVLEHVANWPPTNNRICPTQSIDRPTTTKRFASSVWTRTGHESLLYSANTQQQQQQRATIMGVIKSSEVCESCKRLTSVRNITSLGRTRSMQRSVGVGRN